MTRKQRREEEVLKRVLGVMELKAPFFRDNETGGIYQLVVKEIRTPKEASNINGQR